MNDKIKCPKCGGKGHVKLPKEYLAILAAVKANGGAGTSLEVHDRLCGPNGFTATANLLAKLTESGHLKRDGKRGKCWLYRLATK